MKGFFKGHFPFYGINGVLEEVLAEKRKLKVWKKTEMF